jgi:hypothetical protein
VKAFGGATGAELLSFFAYPGFGGGVRVAAGDLDGDGRAEILTGVLIGPAHVKVFDPAGALLSSSLAAPGLVTGVDVVALDVNGDGLKDVVTVVREPLLGRLLTVRESDFVRTRARVFRGPDLTEIVSPFALNDSVNGVEVG